MLSALCYCYLSFSLVANHGLWHFVCAHRTHTQMQSKPYENCADFKAHTFFLLEKCEPFLQIFIRLNKYSFGNTKHRIETIENRFPEIVQRKYLMSTCTANPSEWKLFFPRIFPVSPYSSALKQPIWGRNSKCAPMLRNWNWCGIKFHCEHSENIFTPTDICAMEWQRSVWKMCKSNQTDGKQQQIPLNGNVTTWIIRTDQRATIYLKW